MMTEYGLTAADLVQRTVLSQRCMTRPLLLHADNGARMKSYILKALLEALHIIALHR